MKKYLRLTCTVCKRSVDRIVDLAHCAPDHCTITQSCEGRLQPVQYRSNGNVAIAPQVGVTDWRPRGSTALTSALDVGPALVDLSTGSLKQLVIGVLQDAPPAPGSTTVLTMHARADVPKAYRQYVFRRDGSFATISGVESGLEKKTLRFSAFGTSPDLVEVFVNGVKRERGTEADAYQLYDGTGTSAAPPNTIVFNGPIEQAGTAQVDVIVSKEEELTAVSLTFTRNQSNEARLGLGAYENVSYVDRFVETLGTSTNLQRYYLYTLDLADADALVLNSILTPAPAPGTIILLARQPFTQLDRYTDLVVDLVGGMDTERDYLKYYAERGTVRIGVTNTAITPIYPRLQLGLLNVELTVKTAVPGVSEQLVLDGKVIVGPDA